MLQQLITQIIQLAQQIYGTVATALRILQTWEAGAGQDLGTLIKNINDVLGTLHDIVSDPTYGNQEIKTEIIALQASVDALGSPQQAGSPVTLPTSPPAGYGGASVSGIWTADLSAYTFAGQAGAFLRKAGWLASNYAEATLALPWLNHEPWLRAGSWDLTDFQNDTQLVAQVKRVDYATILPTDANIQSWLTRVYPVSGVISYSTLSNGQVVAIGPSNNYALLPLTPAQFRQYQNGSIYGTRVPPVWPGASGVTLGTPVALSDGLLITSRMHGVLVDLTTVPPAVQTVTYGTVNGWAHIGALSFGDDDGYQEQFQFLTYEHQQYLPIFMEAASSVVFRVRAGISGQVTPFTIP